MRSTALPLQIPRPLAKPLALTPHEHCLVIIGCDKRIHVEDLKPPFYLVTWANIANIYPSTEMYVNSLPCPSHDSPIFSDLIVDMASKNAKCRLYPTMAEARDAFWDFCRRHHKAEPHECYSASTRTPLHCIMKYLPVSPSERCKALPLRKSQPSIGVPQWLTVQYGGM